MTGDTVRRMVEGISQSRIILVHMSAAYECSKNCQRELNFCYDDETKHLIPVILDKGPFPVTKFKTGSTTAFHFDLSDHLNDPNRLDNIKQRLLSEIFTVLGYKPTAAVPSVVSSVSEQSAQKLTLTQAIVRLSETKEILKLMIETKLVESLDDLNEACDDALAEFREQITETAFDSLQKQFEARVRRPLLKTLEKTPQSSKPAAIFKGLLPKSSSFSSNLDGTESLPWWKRLMSGSSEPSRLPSSDSFLDGISPDEDPRTAKLLEAMAFSGINTMAATEARRGGYVLPSLPSNWSVRDVVAWARQQDSSPQLIRFLKEEEIDGHALLLLTESQLQFLKVGPRIIFLDKIHALEQINESGLAEIEETSRVVETVVPIPEVLNESAPISTLPPPYLETTSHPASPPTDTPQTNEAQTSSTEKEVQATPLTDESFFGDLVLPSLPGKWSAADVLEWVTKNEGTPELIEFVKNQDIDGIALLGLVERDVSFLPIGPRVRFLEKVHELNQINISVKVREEPPSKKMVSNFGDLVLPTLPSYWTVEETVQWILQNGGTKEIVQFVQGQRSGGSTLLSLKIYDFVFPTIGQRIRFKVALEALQERELDEAAPPAY
ncbi:hypothetical protein HDU99_003349, partial [Rhizoclosmatium hyalinum]